MPRRLTLIVALILLNAICANTSLAHDGNTLVPDGYDAYSAGPIPDRVILMLTPTPHTSQAVNWRTNGRVHESLAQITPATGTPGLHLSARLVSGTHQAISSENGLAHYHSVTFDQLQPDTLYAYRVMGDKTWSEWFQFQTPPTDTKSFSFLYFGDAQNSVRSHFSRVIREAFMRNERPAFMLHAGDMVNLRDGNHDDEWGEWFDAGSFLNAMIPSVIVAGNHEFVDRMLGFNRILSPQFAPQFSTPNNGPEGLESTVYHVSYQDTLVVVLDSMSAIYEEDLAIQQANWLDEVLSQSTHRWKIVSHHHPIHSVSAGRDNPVLRKHWQPIYEKYGVDLVLQGHDHTYGRGPSAPSPKNEAPTLDVPMYVVSVAGPKMYVIGDDNNPNMQRMAEELQLYQTIKVSNTRIHFQAWTASGELYDAFEIIQGPDGTRTVTNLFDMDSPIHRCSNPNQPAANRCWDGKELISLP